MSIYPVVVKTTDTICQSHGNSRAKVIIKVVKTLEILKVCT